MIYIENHKKSSKTLTKLYPQAIVVDVTSKGEMPFVMLSPFYPHGGIPVPFSENLYSWTVEGIWQGLKVFDGEDIDPAKFEIQDMKGIKRTVRKLGEPLGHRAGVTGEQLLNYIDARKKIYVPSYRWILQNKACRAIQELEDLATRGDLVLLDYNTNDDIEDPSKPLSHASLVKAYLVELNPNLLKQKTQELQSNELPASRGKGKRKSKKKKMGEESDQTTLNFTS